jgi:hypothetical protein
MLSRAGAGLKARGKNAPSQWNNVLLIVHGVHGEMHTVVHTVVGRRSLAKKTHLDSTYQYKV